MRKCSLPSFEGTGEWRPGGRGGGPSRDLCSEWSQAAAAVAHSPAAPAAVACLCILEIPSPPIRHHSSSRLTQPGDGLSVESLRHHAAAAAAVLQQEEDEEEEDDDEANKSMDSLTNSTQLLLKLVRKPPYSHGNASSRWTVAVGHHHHRQNVTGVGRDCVQPVSPPHPNRESRPGFFPNATTPSVAGPTSATNRLNNEPGPLASPAQPSPGPMALWNLGSWRLRCLQAWRPSDGASSSRSWVGHVSCYSKPNFPSLGKTSHPPPFPLLVRHLGIHRIHTPPPLLPFKHSFHYWVAPHLISFPFC